MDREFYHFYTGPYHQSKNTESKGIMPFNLFQDQSDPLSAILNPTSNSTGLNFKITDIFEGNVYDTSKEDPQNDSNVKRMDVMSTVHIAQYPGKKHGSPENPDNREIIGDEHGIEFPNWKELETPLIDKHFNLLLRDEAPSVFPKQTVEPFLGLKSDFEVRF